MICLYGQRSAAGQLGDLGLGDRIFRGPSPRSPASGETCRRPPTPPSQKGLFVVAVIFGFQMGHGHQILITVYFLSLNMKIGIIQGFLFSRLGGRCCMGVVGHISRRSGGG
jgi:hypothetical protein